MAVQRFTADWLIKRNDKLKSERTNWSQFYGDVRDYIRPRKRIIDDFRTPGTASTNKLHDSTAPNSSRNLALVFAHSLTNRNVQWFQYAVPETGPFHRIATTASVQQWLNAAARTVFNALGESNFYNVIGEIYWDFVSFATCDIFSEERRVRGAGFRGLNFRALPIEGYTFAEDESGQVDTVFRDFTWSARQAAQHWGAENLPRKIQKAAKDEPDKQFEFLRAVLPREEWEPESPFPEDREYALVDVSISEKEIIHEGGYFEFPHHVGRFDKSAGEARGRGPADVAMGDIKSLNKLRELELKGYNRAVQPPILAMHKNIMGRARMQPNAITYAKDISQIREIPTNFRMDLSSLKAEQLVQSIRDIYLTDQIVLPRTKTMTAEEVATLREQVESILGPTVERFQDEVLSPLLERTFGIMFRAGAIPPMPMELEGIERLEIEYSGALARNQKLEQVRSVRNYLGVLNEMALMQQAGGQPATVTQIPDFEKMARLVAPWMGVPGEFLKDKNAVRQAILQVEQAEELQGELAAAEQGSKAIKNVAPLLQEVNA